MTKSQNIGTQINANGNANIGQIGDRVEYHWHAQNMPETIQLQAVQFFAETVAVGFVDLMRLLIVRSSPLAFQHNHERYEEFVEIANVHLTELDKHITRYSAYLLPEVMSNQNMIEHQLNWALNRLNKKPTQPQLDLTLFIKMQQLSEDIDNFCRKSAHTKYQTELELVNTELSEIIEKAQQPQASINVDDFIKTRFGFQQTLLEKYKELRSISDDSNFELGFLYFLIDYQLLKFAKQRT